MKSEHPGPRHQQDALGPSEMVTLEMKGCIEDWRFNDDGSVHVLLMDPVRAHCCGRLRAWFVNRDGETLCFTCDDRRQVEAAGRRFEALMARHTNEVPS